MNTIRMSSEVQARHSRRAPFAQMEQTAGSRYNISYNNNNTKSSSLAQQQHSASQAAQTPTTTNKPRNLHTNIGKQTEDFQDNQLYQTKALLPLDNHSTERAATETPPITTPETGKENEHHVGPVMGIFFKVWSLVKVTKMRNHQKMRRQNSEDTSQFHYISGDQLASGGHHSGAVGSNQQVAMLQDRHFRRAGSQPATSSSACSGSTQRPPLEPLGGNLDSALANRLQVHSPSTAATTTQVSTTTGTNSTSSGVSSTTSSTLANTTPPSSAVRRHVSAYSLRRSGTANEVVVSPPILQPAPYHHNKASAQVSSSSGGSSWTAKIKRSATSVNQADLSSYVSRYGRFRSDQSCAPRQLSAATGASLDDEGKDKLHQQRQRRRMSDAAMSDDDYDDDQNGGEVDEEEEDSNDIYSTPNDSIQSVPSSGPILYDREQGLAQVHNQTTSQAYPIIKSFSTSNFSQLLKQQQSSTTTNGCPKFKPIDELNVNGDNQNNNHFQRNDSNKQLVSGSKSRLNGSRFFISSSSSEDSNSPSQQQQQSLDQKQQQKASADGGANQLQQHHQLLPLQHGVHYHGQSPNVVPSSLIVTRPDTLLMAGAAPTSTGGFIIPVSLFTPNAASICAPINLAPSHNGSTVQSPLDWMPSSSPFAQPTCLSGGGGGQTTYLKSAYRKSPSLYEISNNSGGVGPTTGRMSSTRFSSKYPLAFQQQQQISSFGKPYPAVQPVAPPGEPQSSSNGGSANVAPPNTTNNNNSNRVPNSISLHDCKLSSATTNQQRADTADQLPPDGCKQVTSRQERPTAVNSEYRLAQMLLECGSNPSAKDSSGCTALMHAVLSDNLPAIKCLVEHGANLNDFNHDGLSALDLVCSRAPTTGRLEILKLLIENRADLDRTRQSDGTRLLDRLISDHQASHHHHQQHNQHFGVNNKLPFIDFLLQNGAKLGSSTWLAANGKNEIQLRLLKKLCQDGYFLYKKCSIEAAVYRFEYALKRITELEQQLASSCRHSGGDFFGSDQITPMAARQIKYQTYLGLSRCERKRKFYKRALEFAHMAILVDSTSYEGYYSKAHILKDLGEIDDSLIAIDQTSRLVEKSIETIRVELKDLQQREEALIFDGCFKMLDSQRSGWIEATKLELSSNLEYMQEAKKYISRLKGDIMDDKLRNSTNNQTFSTNPIAI